MLFIYIEKSFFHNNDLQGYRYFVYPCNTCTTLKKKVTNKMKVSDTSNLFNLPFSITFLLTILPLSIYPNGPNQPNWLSYSCLLSFPLLMH